MALLSINWQPSTRDLRVFGGLLAVFLWILAGWATWNGQELRPAAALGGLGALSAFLATRFPARLRLVYVAWMVAAFPIGWTISHLLLLIVFYVVLTPIGLALRLCGYDALTRRFDPAAESYWVPHQSPKSVDRYFRQS